MLAYAFWVYYITNFLSIPIIEVKSGFVCNEMSKYYDKGNFFLLIFILSFYIPLVNIFVTNGWFFVLNGIKHSKFYKNSRPLYIKICCSSHLFNYFFNSASMLLILCIWISGIINTDKDYFSAVC